MSENMKSIYYEESKYDKKKKLNRHEVEISIKELDIINEGITSETLQKMLDNEFPIYYYRTQITLHGLFDKLPPYYVRIFQNKNKSIGIRYTTIDETKRVEIAKQLSKIGFRYYKST